MNRTLLSFIVSVFSLTSLLSFASAATPVASYSFDEGSGTTISDRSGNGNTGSVVGGASWSTGKYGNAVSIVSDGQKVIVQTSPQTEIIGSFTLEAWIKPNSLPSSYNPILIKASGYPSNYSYFLQGDKLMWKWAGSSDYFYSSATVQANVWQHVAVSYDAVAKRWTHYINGVASGSGTETRAPEAYTGPLYIGSNDGSGFFPGVIDDVRIYNTALTATEIQVDMNTPVGGTTATPVVTTPTTPTPTPTNGTCGSSNNQTLSSIPTTNLCSTGTASSVTNSSSYTWSCSGTNGGTTASCGAGKVVVTPVAPVVVTPTVNGGTAKLASLAASLQPGQWTVLNNDGDASGYNWNLLVACTAPNNSGDCGDTIINYADKGLWDPNTKEIHFLGAGHLRAWKFITYSASTDKWIRQPKPYFDCRETESLCWPMGHGYEHSTINPENGDIYWRGFSSSEMYRWTKATGTWAPLESSSNPNPTIVGALAYFPEMGGLLFIGGGKVHFFNETTNTWSQLASNLPMAEYHNVATYDPINKIVIFGGGNNSSKLHKINAAGVITAIADAPAAVGVNSSVFTVDPASGKFLLFTWAGSFHEYNVTTNTWSNLNSASVPIWNTGAQNKSEFRVAIPISTYGVVAIMGYNPRTVWLYKHSSSGAVPVPTPVPLTPTTPTPSPTNGTCGSSNNQTLSSTPTTNLCTTGTASSVTNSSSYTWSCSGTNGGTTASCSAGKVVAAPVAPVVVPVVNGTTITTLKLSSPTAGAKSFTVGQVFKEGDVPNGYYINSSDAVIQSEIKNRWPDGSAKFAILSGQVSLASNIDKVVSLIRTTTVPSGTALTLANLKATGVTASISYGSYGTVSWLNADWDSPFKTLSQGPVMSSWTYRKSVGSDPHLVAWLEVRLYQNGVIEVVPWLENGYLKVAAPGERSGVASFTLSGSQRYSGSLNLLNHQRAYLGSGTTLSHWLGEDPQVTPKHNVDYMMATKMVPNYKADSTNSSTLFGRLPSSYTPLAQASYPAGMGTAGYHSSIGILPEWDAAFFTTNADVRAYRSVLINGYAAGRFGVHFRDENTNLPIRFSSYPNLVVGEGSSIGSSGASNTGEQTPNSTGVTPPAYNSSHHPSMGYLAYLLTGRQYFLEELQFVTTLNFLKNSDSARSNSKGIFLTTAGANTTRGAAWAIRTLAQAAAVTPDNDPLRTEFVNSINENIKYYEGRYVSQPTNPLGLVQPYSNYNGTNVDPHASAIWMDDFFTMSFGYLKDLKVYSSSLQKKIDDFVMWKYQSVVGRLGGSGDDQFSYRYVGQYTVNYAPKNNPDYDTGAGPWYSSWGAVARSMNKGNSGEIGESIVDGYPGEATGYISNMLPALSYAVEHGAAGAGAAWTRFSSASNFNSHMALYKNDPVWSIYPRTFTSVPSPSPSPTTPSPTNGTCGSSHNQTLSSTPTTNLCTSGTASSVTNSSSYTWSCSGTNGGTTASCSALKSTVVTPTTPPSTKFSIGSRVQTTSNLNVRSVPSTTEGLLGVQSIGILGTVTGGPITQGGYTWWNVNFDSGFDGYVAEDFIAVYTSPTPPTTPTTPTPTTPTNGTCGTSSGAVLSSIPTTNLCTTGTASAVTVSTDILSWSCAGTNGGTTASCRAIKPVGTTPTPTPTPAPVSSPSSPLPLTKGVPVAIASMTKGQAIYYTFTIATGTTNLTITTTGSTGDADIYLNKDKVRTSKASTWKSTKSASTEKITLLSPKPGKYFLTLRAYSATTNTVLKMEYVGGDATPIAMCSYAAPPVGCTYVQGSSYNSSTGCGMVLTCTVTPVVTTPTTPTPTPSNGTCGSSNNQTLSSSPTTNLCSTGTASSVTNSSSYTWSCTGINGGTTASCSATKSVAVIPTQPPVSTAVPSSIANMQAGQWMELPNTKIRSVLPSTPQQGSPLNIIDAWSGGTVDTTRSRLLVWGGGHNDYWGNEMYALDLPTLSIKRIVEPSSQTPSSNCVPALPDGTPVSRHTYDGLTYMTHADSFFAVSGSMSPCGFAAGDTWVYNFAQNKWQQKAPAPSAANYGTLAVYDSSTQKVFVKEPGYNFFSYSLESNTYNKLNTSDQYIDYHLSAAIDSKRRKFIMIGDGVQVIDLATNQMTTMQTTGAPAFVTSRQSPGIAYDPVADRIVAWHGGTNVYTLNMDTGVWAQVAINQGPTAAAPYQGTFGRFGYIPQYGVFALINSIDQNAWVFKLSPGGITSTVSSNTSGSVLGVSAIGFGANNSSSAKVSSGTSCVIITSNLHRGNETLNTRKLQDFLFTQGFLTDTPTGFYGDKTVTAVKAYQRSNNLTESGMVYEATRQMIKAESCGN